MSLINCTKVTHWKNIPNFVCLHWISRLGLLVKLPDDVVTKLWEEKIRAINCWWLAQNKTTHVLIIAKSFPRGYSD